MTDDSEKNHTAMNKALKESLELWKKDGSVTDYVDLVRRLNAVAARTAAK